MRTVDYSEILRGSAALAGLQPSDLTAAEFALLRSAHDRRLQMAWECHRWPEICTYERRSFRAPYDAAHTYAAGDEVLDILTLNYFQALTATTGNPPTVNGVENSAYWAVCQASYPADPYNAGTAYQLGAQVLNPADGLVYQLYNNLPATVDVNGVTCPYVLTVKGSGIADGIYVWQPGWPLGSWRASSGANIWQNASFWVLSYQGKSLRSDDGSYVLPPSDVSQAWSDYSGWVDAGGLTTPTVAAATYVPPPGADAGLLWSAVKPFNRYVAYEQTLANGTALTPIGEILGAWDFDPRVTTKLTPLRYTLSADGAQFTTLARAVAYVWLLFRMRRPMLTGDAWDATAIYASGRQVYFVNAAGTGNFYTATDTTAAGESPATTPAKWSQVVLPYTFRQYLIAGGQCDWLLADGQHDKAQALEGQAQALLEAEADKLQRQQGQANRLTYR